MAIEDRAIVVGISKYPDLGDLDGPENDAREFRDWVVSSGGVAPTNARLILSSDLEPKPNGFPSYLEAAPTTTEIYRQIDWLNGLAEENDAEGLGLRVGKRLYLYFAGHGFGPRLEEAAILMANTNKKKVRHHIPGRLNALRFMEEGLFEEVILLMDCCRETQARVPLASLPYASQKVPMPNITKRFFGYSCKMAQLSRERPIGGKTHGVFSATVMKALRGAAAVDGKITAADLASYVYDNMKLMLDEADKLDDRVAKEPDVDIDPNEGKNFVITTIAQPVASVAAADPTFLVTITFLPARYGRQIDILDGAFNVIASTTASAVPWTVPLKRALYLLVDGADRKPLDNPGTGPFNDQF